MILVVVVKREKVEELEALMELAGLSIGAIYVECYILYNFTCALLSYNNISISKQSCLLMDIGTNKIKVILIHNGQLVYINNVMTKYNEYLLKLLSEDNKTENKNYNNVQEYIEMHVVKVEKFVALVDIVVNDVLKHIQLAKSQILIEHKINIQRLATICITGGGVCIPGLVDKLNNTFKLKVIEISTLLQLHNPQMTKNELSRLTTAIALARDIYND